MSIEKFNQVLNKTIFQFGETSILVSNLVFFGISLLLVYLSLKINGILFQRWINKSDKSDTASIYVLQRFCHYFILTIGLFIALTALGLDLTHLALLATALSVGIGFGLQSIFNNFFSGIIILLERSLKVGDFIELDNGMSGTVMEINIRSTRIKTRDNLDVLVPNSEFVNGRVTNWTLDEPSRRLSVPFGVAYGTDKELVAKAALEAASRVSFTLYGKNRQGQSIDPDVWLVNFGDSSLDFHLVVWVDPTKNKRPGALIATYLWEIETSLNEYGIVIPFPQRDLHFISGKPGD